VSDEILNRAADKYRRIRNTARFLLANLNGFNPATDAVPFEQMVELDLWVVNRAAKLQQEIVEAYDNYQFHQVSQKLMNFCTVELGSFYLDVIKDRQYTANTNSIARRSCQTALYHIAEAMVRWIAPIMSFTAQEIWEALPGERSDYVFTSVWYEGLQAPTNTQFSNDDWQAILNVRDEVNRLLEAARKEEVIGAALQATVNLFAGEELANKLTALGDELRFVLLTSAVNVAHVDSQPADTQETEIEGLYISVAATDAAKCERCWHYSDDVGIEPAHPEICGRCVSNVDGEGEKRQFA